MEEYREIDKKVFMTENNLLDSFCEIVLYQFDELYKYYNQLTECVNLGNYEEYFFFADMIKKSYYKVVVFSAMNIEMYINDYLARCIGTNKFKKCFNYKSTLYVKLKYIVENIFQQTFNNETEPFIKWKLLFEERNRLVHCKIEDVYKKAHVYDSTSEDEALAKLGDYLYKKSSTYTQDIYEECERCFVMAKTYVNNIRDFFIYIENNDITEVTPLHKTYSKDNSLKQVCEYQKVLQEALEILKTP